MVIMKCTCAIETPPDKDASEYSNVESKFQVAKYDPESVAKAINFSDPGKFAIRAFFTRRQFRETLFGSGHTRWVLCIFLIFYTVLQIMYQENIVCIFYGGPKNKNNSECENNFKENLNRAKEQNRVLNSIITLFLGFYVSQVVKRWYSQVVHLPDMLSMMNYMTGLIYPANTSEHNTSAGALELSKKIARYCLLSWTMCLSAISSPLNQAFATGEDYINKELITKEELHTLKGNSGGSDDGWKDKWCVPIIWASKLVNQNYNYPKEKEGLIPKDHNKMLDALSKFQKGLQDTRRYQDNPLPIIYKQTILLAVYFWMILGLYVAQDTTRRPWYLAIFMNLPFYAIVKFLLILAWLKVVDFIRNPFAPNYADKKHKISTDIYLNCVLDAEIWRTSVAIKNTNQTVFN